MNTPAHQTETDRCRIVLVTPPLADGAALAKLLTAALSGGDVASVILDTGDLDEATFQAAAEKAIPVIQERALPRSSSMIRALQVASGPTASISKARLQIWPKR